MELVNEICSTSPMSAMLNRHMIIRHGYAVSPEEAHLVRTLCCKYDQVDIYIVN